MDITWSLFPKYYRHLDIGRLAGIAAEAGLESVNVMIRNGYWVSPEGFRKELPIFVKSVKREGLTAQYADIDFSIEHLLEDPALLGVMADNGIKDFRLLYFRMKKEDKNIRSALSDARKFLEFLMPLCERYRIRAICQLHHNTLVSSPSAAWNLINGLPETCIGVKIDPGNQYHEGYESWQYCAGLLGRYIRAVGVKDVSFTMDLSKADTPGKGWQTVIAPLYEGITNWENLVTALNKADFSGTFVFMPFYSTDNASMMTEILKKEVVYLKKIVSEIA